MTARTAIHASTAFALVALATAPAVAQDRIGISRYPVAPTFPVAASLPVAPTLDGVFILHNTTDVTLKYQVRWGNGDWVHHTLLPNERRKHAYPLNGRGQAPAPLVRFDGVGGDRRTTYHTHEVSFGRVGYVGHIGPVGRAEYVNEAVHYDFRFARDGRHLDVFRR